jgi:predicted AAA+ superfamily ATPase
VLIGARQTGKSTLAWKIFEHVQEGRKLYLNMDDPFLRDRLVQTEGLLVRMIEEKAGRPMSALEEFHLVIDEAQKAPALFEIVKDLYDSNPERLRVLFTGSSALAIHDPVAETLAGRARIIQVPPFTLSEGFAHQRGEDPTRDGLAGMLSRLLCGRFTTADFNALGERARWHAADRRKWVEEHLRFPLFPEPSTSRQPEVWLRDYMSTYQEKDIQSLASVGNLTIFRSCIRQVAARTGSPIKWETMAQEVGTTSVTLRKYVGLMEQTFTLVRLGTFALNPVKRVIRAPKLYPVDPGLLWGLRGFEDLRLLKVSGMLGAFAELLAIVEIAKWCSFEPTSPEMRFWSKTAVSEVDLVVSNRGFHIPFEIKLGRKLDRSWLRGLDAFDKDHRDLQLEIPYRIILHMGEPDQLDDRTYLLPLWMLA